MSINSTKGYEIKKGVLDVRNMYLTSLSLFDVVGEYGLPDSVVNGIVRLLCNDNKLTSLPELPKGLLDLYCNHNNLKTIPTLPSTIAIIVCHNNNIEVLPELPDGLHALDCENNKIKHLPKLPDGLELLYCYDNPLECLVPYKFLDRQNGGWLADYYYPYIESYRGQRNILIRQPEMIGDLMKQTKLLDRIKEEFDYLVNGCELNLL